MVYKSSTNTIINKDDLTNILLLWNFYIHKSSLLESETNMLCIFIISLFIIAYKSPQSDEKEKCNKYFVLYRRILFTGKTLAPSSSCLPVLYILMLALFKKKKIPPRTSSCPVSCSLIGCRSSPMYFSVRTGQNSFTQQDWESLTAPDI